MKAYIQLLILGLLTLGVAGCEKDNGLIGDEPAQACKVDADCTGTANICNTEVTEPFCVQCFLPNRTEACTGTTPVCGGSACRICTSHGECPSNACLPNGSCAAEAEVVYLTRGGGIGGGNDCLKAQPCGSWQMALSEASPTRTYIRVSGLIEGANGDIDNGKIRTLLGEPGAVLRGSQFGGGGGGDAPILRVRGVSKVEAYDVLFRDARQQAVRLEEAGSTLKLERSQVVNAGFEGVAVTGGTMTLTRSEVSASGDNTRYGITLQDGELIVDRSRISDNDGGGITVTSGKKITVTNSFIVGNKVGGGIVALTPSIDSKFEFNTIVDNASGQTALEAGGVVCNNAVVSARNNILYRNVGGTGGTVQKVGSCVFTGSFEMSALPADDSLKFKSETAPKDYHLTAASPSSVKDVAGAVCTGLVDYDGETRPQGAACDLGADELKQ